MRLENVFMGIALAVFSWFSFWNLPVKAMMECHEYCDTAVTLCPPGCYAGAYAVEKKECCLVNHTGCQPCYVKYLYNAACVEETEPKLCHVWPSFSDYWAGQSGSGSGTCCCCQEVASPHAWYCYHPCDNPAMCSGSSYTNKTWCSTD